MFLTVHATVGAVLGQSVPNPWIAFVLGFISHFFVDLIPHGDQNLAQGTTHRERVVKILAITALDVLILLLVVVSWYMYYSFTHPLSVAAGAFGAMLPDGLQGITIFSKEKYLTGYTRFHHRFHINNHPRFAHATLSFAVGLSLQILFWLVVQRFIV